MKTIYLFLVRNFRFLIISFLKQEKKKNIKSKFSVRSFQFVRSFQPVKTMPTSFHVISFQTIFMHFLLKSLWITANSFCCGGDANGIWTIQILWQKFKMCVSTELHCFVKVQLFGCFTITNRVKWDKFMKLLSFYSVNKTGSFLEYKLLIFFHHFKILATVNWTYQSLRPECQLSNSTVLSNSDVNAFVCLYFGIVGIDENEQTFSLWTMSNLFDLLDINKPLVRKTISGGTTNGRVIFEQPTVSNRRDDFASSSQYAEAHIAENQQQLLDVRSFH